MTEPQKPSEHEKDVKKEEAEIKRDPALTKEAAISTPSFTGKVETGAKTDKDEMDEIHVRMTDILSDYGGLLSNVPVNSEYWILRNRLSELQEKAKSRLPKELEKVEEQRRKDQEEVRKKEEEQQKKAEEQRKKEDTEKAKGVVPTPAPQVK